MMIAIVILGLGLVMVATMFPVAWDRARKLNEQSLEPNVLANARVDLSTLRPAGLKKVAPNVRPAQPNWVLGYGSFAGDLFYDPTLLTNDPANYYLNYAKSYVIKDSRNLSLRLGSDTRVHALNMQNLLVSGTAVGEDPWKLEQVYDVCADPDHLPWGALSAPGDPTYGKRQYDNACGTTVAGPTPSYTGGALFYSPQIAFERRVHPSMNTMPDTPGPELDQWRARLDSKRFCWAVLHRLRPRSEKLPDRRCSPVGPHAPGLVDSGPTTVGPGCLPPPPTYPGDRAHVPDKAADGDASMYLVNQAAIAMGSARNFDIYYVMLRRQSSTNRYAQQDNDPSKTPDPSLTGRQADPVVPAARPPTDDVMFPIPWRVQVQFATVSDDLPSAIDNTNQSGTHPPPSGVPIEVSVPPNTLTNNAAAALMYIQMFPQGTQFVDEVSGAAYRVIKQRVAADGNSAVLTLDREVLAEELDDGEEFYVPGSGASPQVQLKNDELVRTVWVFPPPADRSGGAPAAVSFSGATPVVNIEVGSLILSPTP